MNSPSSFPHQPRRPERPLTVIAVDQPAIRQSRKRLWLLLGGGIFVLACLFLAAVGVVGWAMSTVIRQARAEKMSWDHNEQGNRYSRQGREDLAIAEYDEAIRLRPDDPAPWCNRGDSWLNRKDYAKALADANQSLALAPNYADAHNLRGLIYYRQDQDAASIPCFDRAIQLERKSAYYHNRANSYLALKDHDKALRDYTEAIRLDGDSPDSFYGRALVYHNLEKWPDALSDYHRTIELKPDYAEAHRGIGSVYLREKNFVAAGPPLDKALELKPDYAAALNDRGLVIQELGNPRQALTYFDKAIQLEPKQAVYRVNRGHAYYDLNDYQKAIADYDAGLRLDPQDATAFASRGNAHSALSDFDAAVQDHDAAVRLKPGDASFLQHRGHVLVRAKQYARAAADYLECVRLDPKHADYQTDAAWLLATCPDDKVRNGQRALELAQRAKGKSDNPSASTAEVLAAAYAETGDFKAAVRWQQHALQSALQYSKEDLQKARERLKLYEKG
ncbi:MAG: tetratricopeptide repeat protein, partial [Planctomycetia bacterium]|nr:tetratricopeptide repeat protein [Planctomycetia bacterium]